MGELIASLENYSIYKSYINDTDSYYLCIPNNNISKCQIVLGFSDKNLDTLSNKDIINKITEVNYVLYSLDNSIIYAILNINDDLFKNAVSENDNRLYEFLLTKYIHPITQNIYNMLIKNGVKKENINQVISVIKKNDDDKKFAGWLSMRLGDDFIKEIDLSGTLKKYTAKEESSNVDISITKNHQINPPLNEDYNDMSILENDSNKIVNTEHRITPVNHEHDNNQTKGHNLVRKPTQPINKSQGFSSFKFIAIFMVIFMIIGISIGYLLIK